MPEKQIAIRPGMSEASDSRQLPIGTPRLLQNVRVRSAARFDKRPGAASLGVSGISYPAVASWVAGFGGQPAVGIQRYVASQLAQSVLVRDAAGYWNDIGRHGFAIPERRFGVVMDNDHHAYSPTSAVIEGVLYVAWNETGTNIIRLVAMTPNGVKLREAYPTLSGSFPRLIYTGGKLYLVHTNSSTNVRVSVVTPSTLDISSATSVGTISGLAPRPVFDAAPLEDGSGLWLVAYAEDATHLRVKIVSDVTAVWSAFVPTTNVAKFISLAGQLNNKVVVTYTDGNDAFAYTFSGTDLSGGAGPVTIHTLSGSEAYRGQSGVVRTGSNEWFVVFSGSDTSSSPAVSAWKLWWARISGTPAITIGANTGYRFLPCSKPFITGPQNSARVSIVAHDALTSGQSLNSAHHIIDIETGFTIGGGQRLAAVSYEHQPTLTTSPDSQAPEVTSLGNGQYFCPINWEDPGDLAGLDGLVFRAARTSDSVEWGTRRVVESAGSLLINGGALYEHAGAGAQNYVIENGFANAPIINSVGVSGGALTAGQDYSYLVTYAWLDQVGNRVHRSAPSAPDTLSPTPTGVWLRGQLKISTLGTSGRYRTSSSDAVMAEIYRSWNGGPYYYVASVDVPGVNQALTVSYNDDIPDATVEANRAIYSDNTPGSILANEPPSGARLVAVGGNRVFTVGWKPRCVECSKLLINSAPWEFCDDDTHRVPVAQDITAIAWMDGALVIFAENAIYLVTGDGPNDQGVGSFADPRELPATVGADSPHVVEVPQGLIYKGAGTLWLLPRGFGPPQPVGDEVQDTLTRFPYLRTAVRCSNADDDVTHFVLAASDLPAAETKVAIWDNRLGSWSLDDVAGEVGAAGAVNGQFTWMLPSWPSLTTIPIRQYDVTQYQDLTASGTNAWVESRVEFGDWRPFGPLGWGRLNALQIHAQVSGVSRLNLDVTCGQSGYTVRQTCTGVGERYWEHAVKYPQEGNFRFSIYDSIVTAYNGGIALHAVAYSHSEPEDGLRRLSNAERF